jgi:hypothetical protein
MVLDFELVLGVRFISEYATRYGFAIPRSGDRISPLRTLDVH